MSTVDQHALENRDHLIGRRAAVTTAEGTRVEGTLERDPRQCAYLIVRADDGGTARTDQHIHLIDDTTPKDPAVSTPTWADPAQTMTDPTNGEQIHRHVTTRTHGDHEARVILAAGEGEPPALFVEVLSGEHGLTAEQAEALTQQITDAAALLR